MLQHQQNNLQISKATFTIFNSHNAKCQFNCLSSSIDYPVTFNASSIDYPVTFNKAQFPYNFLSEASWLFKNILRTCGYSCVYLGTWVLGSLGMHLGSAGGTMWRIENLQICHISNVTQLKTLSLSQTFSQANTHNSKLNPIGIQWKQLNFRNLWKMLDNRCENL